MCSVMLKLVLFTFLFKKGFSTCRHTYMTFCDNLKDLPNFEVEDWTGLVLGSENAASSDLQEVNFDSFMLDRFEKLTTLFVVRQIKDIKTYTFGGLDEEDTKLEYLSLFGNEIKRIRFTTFDSIRLRKLSLVNNSIEYIHKEAFYNCEINTIDLSDNKLEAVEQEVFTEEFLGNATKEIVLKNNRLEAIAPKSFPSSLEILNLDHNNLNVLLYDVFANLHNLKVLTISHNKITSLPGVKELKQINTIDASHNELINLKAAEFNDLSDLEVLDFSHNKITYPLVFKHFNFPQRHPSLQISLAFNRLTHLLADNESFKHHIVFLYGNPWDCRCWASLEKFMVDNKVKRNKCDLQFFGNGQVPYCINYACIDCQQAKFVNPNITVQDYQQFLDLIEGSQQNVGCKLRPKRL